MNYYTFEYPFLILLLLPILYCMYKCKEHIKPIYFVHLHFMKAKRKFIHLEWLIKIVIFTLLLIAISSPVITDRLNQNNRNGKDIVLTIDASGSMNSSGFDFENDVSNNLRLSRFEITKIIAKDFILKRNSDNIGIVIYGDFAFIASPITYEKVIVSDMLDYLTQGMAGQNTAIGEAIAMSVRAFKHSKAKSKIVILLSDGEHNSGKISPKEAVKLAVLKNIKIYTIAIGNRGEADEALLQQIATDTQGEFFTAVNAKELQNIYEKINDLESSSIKSREYLFQNYYYHLVLLLSLAFLLFLISKEVKK